MHVKACGLCGSRQLRFEGQHIQQLTAFQTAFKTTKDHQAASLCLRRVNSHLHALVVSAQCTQGCMDRLCNSSDSSRMYSCHSSLLAA